MDDIDAGRARRPIVNAGQVALKCTLRDEYENSVDWDYRVCGISYPYLGSGSGARGHRNRPSSGKAPKKGTRSRLQPGMFTTRSGSLNCCKAMKRSSVRLTPDEISRICARSDKGHEVDHRRNGVGGHQTGALGWRNQALRSAPV